MSDNSTKAFYYGDWRDYPEFYGNPTIQELGKKQRWAVSGILDPTDPKGKAPIDMAALLYPGPSGPRICGNRGLRYQMLTLDQLSEKLPQAANCAYHANHMLDNYLILDLEKEASPKLRQALLSTSWLYAEVSMSGKGLHFIEPLPEDIDFEFPNLMSRPSVRIFNNTLELLTNHWCTFTRHVIPRGPSYGTIDLMGIIRPQMEIKWQDAIDKISISVSEPEIPYADVIKTYVAESIAKRPFTKKPTDFLKDDNATIDASLYEYNYAKYILYYVWRALFFVYKDHDPNARAYTPDDAAWITYDLLQDEFERIHYHRDKFNHVISGLPYLLHTAKSAVENKMHYLDPTPENSKTDTTDIIETEGSTQE